MNQRTLTLIAVNLLIFAVGVGGILYKKHQTPPPAPIVQQRPDDGMTNPLPNPPELPPIINNITKAQPSYMNYEATVAQLQTWNKEAPEMTEVGSYGKTARGKDIY